MERIWERLRDINERWNHLPHKLLLIVALLLLLFLAVGVLPFVAPFALAAVFAYLIEPVVRWVSKLFGKKERAGRVVGAALSVLVLTGVLLLLTLVLTSRAVEEVKYLAMELPGWASQATESIIAWIESLDFEWQALGALEATVRDALRGLVNEAGGMLTSLASRAATFVARLAWQTAASLPQIILFIVLTLMGTLYMSADRERIGSYLGSLLPAGSRLRTAMYRTSVLRALFTQVRAALIMMLITFVELSAGFLITGLDYAILFALIIAVLDALPVIGAGLFLIPATIYGVVVGDLRLALGFGLTYVTTIVVRQIMEPRIIGKQLGLYPLATMMAMYAGLQVMGFVGMLLGPMMLLLCKVVITAEEEKKEIGGE